jgi:hypothetical protein
VKSAPRLTYTLVPSRIRIWVIGFCALLIGVSLAVVIDVWLSANWILSTVVALVAALALIKFAKSADANTSPVTLIFADSGLSGQLWIGSTLPPGDAVLPGLAAMRGYLGLIWLCNSAGAQILIWPDSIGAEGRRRVRVWLGIHARQR